MSQFIVVDGINTTLADAVTTTDTSITLASSANLPALLAGQILPLIVQSASNASAYEIMYGTAISGAEITVTRGMEGTTAQAFNVGDYVLCGPTAGSNALIRAVMNPATSTTLSQAYGAAVFPSGLSGAITLTLPNTVPAGTSYVIYGNTSYAVTVAVSVASGSPYIALPDGSQVYSWTIPAGTGQGMRIDFGGANWRAQTFGQTVVAPATQSNAAVQLNQLFIGNRKAVFTANGNFPVPSFVSTIWVTGCAGGAGGGGGGGNVANPNFIGGGGGGGGGAGEFVIKTPVSVTGGESLTIAIGAYGSGGANGSGSGAGGGDGGGGGNTVLSNSSGALVTLTGGSRGGGGSGQTSGTAAIPSGGAGGPGGTGYPYGGYGTDGNYAGNGGDGASGPFGGGGGRGRAGNGSGNNGYSASGYGAGGGGGGGCYGQQGSAGYGANGAPGLLIIEW